MSLSDERDKLVDMEDKNQPVQAPNDRPVGPVMDVVAPEVADTSKSDTKLDEEKLKNTKVTKTAKQPGSGVGLAIVATVIIVLGLAALVVYAYLKTKN